MAYPSSPQQRQQSESVKVAVYRAVMTPVPDRMAMLYAAAIWVIAVCALHALT